MNTVIKKKQNHTVDFYGSPSKESGANITLKATLDPSKRPPEREKS